MGKEIFLARTGSGSLYRLTVSVLLGKIRKITMRKLLGTKSDLIPDDLEVEAIKRTGERRFTSIVDISGRSRLANFREGQIVKGIAFTFRAKDGSSMGTTTRVSGLFIPR